MSSCATALIFYGINLGDGDALQKKFPEVNFGAYDCGDKTIEELCREFKLEKPEVELEFTWDTIYGDIIGAFLFIKETYQQVPEYESEPLQNTGIIVIDYNSALKPFAEKFGIEFDPKFWVTTCDI